MSVWDEIAAAASAESSLWADCLSRGDDRERVAVFSPLADPAFALGIETIYEGYLAHYGQPRVFAPADEKTALLLGDYLYAHGLVRIAALGRVRAVADLAELISLCAQLRADGGKGDGCAWAATAAALETETLPVARDALRDGGDPQPLEELARSVAGDPAVDAALAAHAAHVG